MSAIDSNQVEIIELEAEVKYLHNYQEKINAELKVKFTPKKNNKHIKQMLDIVKQIRKIDLFLTELAKTIRKEKETT